VQDAGRVIDADLGEFGFVGFCAVQIGHDLPAGSPQFRGTRSDAHTRDKAPIPKGDIVLTLTDAAQETIESLLETPGISAAAGMRIAASHAGNSSVPKFEDLQATLVEEPDDGDVVIEHEGARVFMQQELADFLDDKLLDAKTTDAGTEFMLTTQT
jgi:iron-sulfur cluster assembly protein